MAHARDRKFTYVYVDRDFGRWQAPSVGRRITLLAGNFTPEGPEVGSDQANNACLLTKGTGTWSSSGKMLSEAWYDAGGGNPIGHLYFAQKKGPNVSAADTNWYWGAFLVDDDNPGSFPDQTGSQRTLGDGTNILNATSGTRRYAMVEVLYSVAGGADNLEYSIQWPVLAVYGNHGIPLAGPLSLTEAPGVQAGGVIKHIAANWCPGLNTAGVGEPGYQINQLAFLDRTDPYDAFLEVNKYSLWDLAVWENKTLTYAPVDLSDYDWQVRADDPGVTIDLQGDSSETLANGIAVEFDNVQTGKKDVPPPVGPCGVAGRLGGQPDQTSTA